MNFYNIFQILIGFIGLIALAIPFSDSIKKINYKYIFYGILAQIFLALILLKIQSYFQKINLNKEALNHVV